MLTNSIALIFGNLGFVLFIVALVAIMIDWPLQRLQRYIPIYEIIYRWIALLPLGVTGLYTGALHILLPSYTAANIGWQTSPFQFEVGMADLGFGLIGVLSARASYGFRLATVIGNTCWLWGDAVGHIYQIIFHHNFSVGNAGSWFWMDIIIPLILIICIMKLKRQSV